MGGRSPPGPLSHFLCPPSHRLGCPPLRLPSTTSSRQGPLRCYPRHTRAWASPSWGPLCFTRHRPSPGLLSSPHGLRCQVRGSGVWGLGCVPVSCDFWGVKSWDPGIAGALAAYGGSMGPWEVQPRALRAKAAGALPPAPCLRVLPGFWESLLA